MKITFIVGDSHRIQFSLISVKVRSRTYHAGFCEFACIERKGEKEECVCIQISQYPRHSLLTQQFPNDGQLEGLENVGQKHRVGMMRLESRRHCSCPGSCSPHLSPSLSSGQL